MRSKIPRPKYNMPKAVRMGRAARLAKQVYPGDGWELIIEMKKILYTMLVIFGIAGIVIAGTIWTDMVLMIAAVLFGGLAVVLVIWMIYMMVSDLIE